MQHTNSLTEAQLISQLKEGNDLAFEVLYDKYASLLLGFIFRIVQNRKDAENLLQDCFVKIWHNIQHYDGSKGRFTTWLLYIARNLAIDYTRSKYFSQKQKNQNLEKAVLVGEAFSREFSIDTMGLKEHIQQLAPVYREIIEYLYFEGYTQQEVADTFQIPLGTVKTRTRFALKELRKIFHEKE